jgi:hypothetical protein
MIDVRKFDDFVILGRRLNWSRGLACFALRRVGYYTIVFIKFRILSQGNGDLSSPLPRSPVDQ